MRLFELRLNKLITALKNHNIDTERVVLQSKYALSYIFADLYNPPPEELSVFTATIDMNTMMLEVYVASLEYYRFVETYGYLQNLVVHPVAPLSIGIEFDREIVDIKDMKNAIARLCRDSKRVSVDSGEVCGNDSSNIRIDIRSIIRKIRRSKTEEEVNAIRKAVEVAEKAIENAISELESGLSEQAIAGLIESRARELGAEGFAFSTIVAVGVNTSKPHHTPSSMEFRGREPILIDFGVRINGYVSDITRIILPSSLQRESEVVRDLISVVSDAIDSSIRHLKIGERYSDVDEMARSILMKSNVHRYFIHGLGHGIGVDVHEEPRITKNSEHEVESGDVVTVEPGIYIYKKFGIRIEDDVYITPSKPIKLTSLERVIEL